MPEDRSCAREGCSRKLRRNSRFEYCTAICSSLVREFEHLQWLPAIASSEGTEAWTKLVEVADLWDEYQTLQNTVYQQGRSMKQGPDQGKRSTS